MSTRVSYHELSPQSRTRASDWCYSTFLTSEYILPHDEVPSGRDFGRPATAVRDRGCAQYCGDRPRPEPMSDGSQQLHAVSSVHMHQLHRQVLLRQRPWSVRAVPVSPVQQVHPNVHKKDPSRIALAAMRRQ